MARMKTRYPGVFYREAQRIWGKGTEKVFYVVFKKDGKVLEEKVGREFADDMSPAKAARIRSQRIEGKRVSRKEAREQQRAEREAQENRWSFDRLWQEYKARNPHLKELRIREYQWAKHLKALFGHKEPREVTPFEMDALRVKLLRKLKPQTVKHLLSFIVRLARFGERKQFCPGLPFQVQLPKVDNEKTEFLTPKQVAALLNACDEDPCTQAGAIMKMALFTGLRRSELFRLRWEDVNFEENFIHIRDPKPGHSLSIPMNAQARSLLENHARESEFVFPGRNGMQRTDVTHQIRRIAEKAGIPASVRPLHGLRHSFASQLASNGVDLYVIQRLLGHRSVAMTARYSHLVDVALRRASDLAGRLVPEATRTAGEEETGREAQAG